MNVCFLVGSLSRSGAGVFEASRLWAHALQAMDRGSVVAMGLKDEYTASDSRLWGSIRTYACSVVGSARYGYSPDFWKHLSFIKPELIHLHGLWMYPSRATLKMKKRTGCSVVVSPYGMLEPWALRNSSLKKAVMRWLQEDELLQTADCLHALSEAEALSLRRLGLRQPIFVAPTGAPQAPTDFSAEWRSAPGNNRPRRLVFLGRIHEKKGVFDLVRAWGQLATRPDLVSKWELVLAGWGTPSDLDRLERCIADVPNACRPKFIGPRYDAEKWDFLATADAFVLPSWSEGMPVSVLEAWAAGLPVLMTDECHLELGFSHGAAYRIKPGQEGIMEGLIALCGDRILLGSMGESARRLVKERFGWERIAADTADLYAWLRKEASRPACVHLT